MNKIIIHHSLTSDDKTVSWSAIRRYHMNKGWMEIGYNWGIEKVNDCYEILAGRPLWMDGAHTRGHNADAVGICVIGNYDLAAPPDEALQKLYYITYVMQKLYRIPDDFICFHREFARYKSCPGRLFDKKKFLTGLRSYKHEHII